MYEVQNDSAPGNAETEALARAGAANATEASTDAPPPDVIVPPGEVLRSPTDHAAALGHLKPRTAIFNGLAEPIRSPAFRAAEQIHGWAAHEFHTGSPMLLTQEDFEAAIAAAHEPDERGAYSPHAPALAPHLRGNS